MASSELDAYLKIYPFDLTSSHNASSRNQKIRHILKNLYVLLGHGQRARDIKEAVAKLMIRNYPEILEWDGVSKLVVLVPEFYLNKATEYVNPEDGPNHLRDLDDLALSEANPERREHLESHAKKFFEGKQMWMGEYPELNLYDALTKYSEKKNESLAIFHGLDLYKFDPDRNPGRCKNENNNALTTASADSGKFRQIGQNSTQKWPILHNYLTKYFKIHNLKISNYQKKSIESEIIREFLYPKDALRNAS